MQYLRDEQYYIDRYDLHTIEECLDTVKMFQDIYQKILVSVELKDLSQENKLKDANIMLHRTLFVIKGKRYEKKQETIQKWMEDDKFKQDKQDYTPVPEGIVCPLCNGLMHFNSSKHLDYTYDSPIMRIMFLFKCIKCKKQQWVYDDGEIRVSKPDLCPKCKKEIDVSHSRKRKVITWKYNAKLVALLKLRSRILAKRMKSGQKNRRSGRKKKMKTKNFYKNIGKSSVCLIKKA